MSPPEFPHPFVAGDSAHWATLAVIGMLAGLLVWQARAASSGLRWQEWGLATILLLNFPVSLPIMDQAGLRTRDNSLPLHLCDVTAICAGLALLTRRQTLVELTWFWGLAGAGNSILTPTAKFHFPHPENLWFFAMHGGIVIAAVHLVVGKKRWPRPRSVWRALLFANVYLAVVAPLNAWLGTNYGYLCHKPDSATLLDFLGPWPWYLAALQAVALSFFLVLYAPFWFLRKGSRTSRQATADHSA